MTKKYRRILPMGMGKLRKKIKEIMAREHINFVTVAKESGMAFRTFLNFMSPEWEFIPKNMTIHKIKRFIARYEVQNDGSTDNK